MLFLQKPRIHTPAKRAATSLIELLLCLAVLGALFTLLPPLFSGLQRERRATQQRRVAIQEIANALETIAQWPWDRLTQEQLNTLAFSEPAQRALGEATFQALVSDADEEPFEARKISVEVTWKDRAGNQVAPMRVTTWIHRRQETLP